MKLKKIKNKPISYFGHPVRDSEILIKIDIMKKKTSPLIILKRFKTGRKVKTKPSDYYESAVGKVKDKLMIKELGGIAIPPPSNPSYICNDCKVKFAKKYCPNCGLENSGK